MTFIPRLYSYTIPVEHKHKIQGTLFKSGSLNLLGFGFLYLLPVRLLWLLCRYQHLVDVGHDAGCCDCDLLKQLAEFLVVAHGQQDVARAYAVLLVVPCGISGQLKQFGGKILQDWREVDWCSGSDACRILALLQIPRQATDWKLSTQSRVSLRNTKMLQQTSSTRLTPKIHPINLGVLT